MTKFLGTCFLIGTVLCGASVRAEFVLLEDFELQRGNLHGQNGWDSYGGKITADPENTNNIVGYFGPGSGSRGTAKALLIPKGQTGTVFFRMRVGSDNSDPTTKVLNWGVGLTDILSTTASLRSLLFFDMEVLLNQNRDGLAWPEAVQIRDGGQYERGFTMAPGVWHDVWMVVNNQTNRTRFYIRGGTLTEPTLVRSPGGKEEFLFRNSAILRPATHDLVRFMVTLHSVHQGAIHIDDIWVNATGGQDLSDPTGKPVAPKVSALVPTINALFHKAGDGIRFSVTPDASTSISTDGIQVILNGEDVTPSLSVSEESGRRNVRFEGLENNREYSGVIKVRDNTGRERLLKIDFDTFVEKESLTIEVEDYNFTEDVPGSFLDDPPPSGRNPEGNLVNAETGYVLRQGTAGIDFYDPLQWTGHYYRTNDKLPLIVSGDTIRSKFLDVNLPDIDTFGVVTQQWRNFTRTFDGEYTVLLRYAASADVQFDLERVTSDPSKPEQTIERLGSFFLKSTDFTTEYAYGNLTDTPYGPVRSVSLSGIQTLRLTAKVANWNVGLNYLLLVPVAERPRLSTLRLTAEGFRFEFDSKAGTTYQARFRSNLVSAPWQPFQTIIGDGMRKEIIHPAGPEGGFYQVISE